MPVNTSFTKYGQTYSNPINKGEEAKRTKRYGMGFPFGSKLSGGYFHRISGIESAKASVRQVLSTERGERIMLPNFGASLKKYLFEPLDETTYQNVKYEVVTSISRYVKDVRIMRLRVIPFTGGGAAVPGFKVELKLKLFEDQEAIFDVSVDIE